MTEVTQMGEIGNPFVDVEIVRIVDGRLCAQGMLLFEILLHVRVLVLNMQTGLYSVGDHPRAIAECRRRSRASDPERKQEPDAIGATEVEILADERLEEVPSLHGAGEHVRQTHLKLRDREAMVVAG